MDTLLCTESIKLSHLSAMKLCKVNVAMELSASINVFTNHVKLCILTGNHTVGIVSGSEDYDTLKASCKDLFA